MGWLFRVITDPDTLSLMGLQSGCKFYQDWAKVIPQISLNWFKGFPLNLNEMQYFPPLLSGKIILC